jgi:hypothetical protein
MLGRIASIASGRFNGPLSEWEKDIVYVPDGAPMAAQMPE